MSVPRDYSDLEKRLREPVAIHPITGEVIRMDNPDWRDVITDDQTVMGRFPNSQEADALCAKLEAEFRIDAALSALEAAGWEVNRKGTREALDALWRRHVCHKVQESAIYCGLCDGENAPEGLSWRDVPHEPGCAFRVALAPPEQNSKEK